MQIGAFSIRANAETMAADARSKGFSPYIVFTGGLYKVQLGAFSVRANAEALAQQARAAGYSPIIAIPLFSPFPCRFSISGGGRRSNSNNHLSTTY
ncbi:MULTISPECIES: SPOR domain-containing protein [unclassified Paenibacillus]|uniref:SPOR domain-containing protein n=1 Tax=unclassified Paenibacillus TaxID=185978 RepID=UPI0021B5C887|nr:SPOR domain-containing protein [Paenibacillus sp. 32O-W]